MSGLNCGVLKHLTANESENSVVLVCWHAQQKFNLIFKVRRCPFVSIATWKEKTCNKFSQRFKNLC